MDVPNGTAQDVGPGPAPNPDHISSRRLLTQEGGTPAAACTMAEAMKAASVPGGIAVLLCVSALLLCDTPITCWTADPFDNRPIRL